MALQSLAWFNQELEDPPEFVEKLDPKFKCVRCKEILRVPHQTECGHRVCIKCKEYYSGLKTPEKCPGGEEDCLPITADNIIADPGIARDLSKLKVYCSYKENGCEETMQLRDLQKHLDECKFGRIPCINAEKGCEEIFRTKKQRDDHVANMCAFTEKECEHCGNHFLLSILANHRENCPMRSVACPYKCGEQVIKLGQLEAHKRGCPAKPQECPFKAAGCEYMGHTEDSLDRHIQDPNTMIEHQMFLLKIVEELELQKESWKNKLATLEEKCSVLERHLPNAGELTADIKRLKDEVDKNKKGIARIGTRNFQLEEVLADKANKETFEKVKQESNILTIKAEKLENRVSNIESGMVQGSGNLPANLKQKLRRHDELLSLHEVTLSEMDIRFQCIETGSTDGVLLWKIREYSSRKSDAIEGKTLSLYSQPFYTSRTGYKMCARVYLNGDGVGKGTHMSLFFVIMRGEYDDLLKWPFSQKITLCLLDPSNPQNTLRDSFVPNPKSSSFKKPVAEMNVASGCPLFVTKSNLESGRYIIDDTIYIKIIVDLTNCPSA